jgi:hypothetical protein
MTPGSRWPSLLALVGILAVQASALLQSTGPGDHGGLATHLAKLVDVRLQVARDQLESVEALVSEAEGTLAEARTRRHAPAEAAAAEALASLVRDHDRLDLRIQRYGRLRDWLDRHVARQIEIDGLALVHVVGSARVGRPAPDGDPAEIAWTDVAHDGRFVVRPGDRLETLAGASVIFHLSGEATLVEVGPLTAVRFEEATPGALSLFLENGRTLAWKLGLPERRFRMRTPGITVGVRGTIVAMEHTPVDGRSQVHVLDGIVDVATPVTGGSVALGHGQGLAIEARSAKHEPTRFDLELELARWSLLSTWGASAAPAGGDKAMEDS